MKKEIIIKYNIDDVVFLFKNNQIIQAKITKIDCSLSITKQWNLGGNNPVFKTEDRTYIEYSLEPVVPMGGVSLEKDVFESHLLFTSIEELMDHIKTTFEIEKQQREYFEKII